MFPAEACTFVGVAFALELAELTPATFVVLVLSVSTFGLTVLTTAAALDVLAAMDTVCGVEDAIWLGAVVTGFAGGAEGDVLFAGAGGVVSTTGQMVV